MSSRASQIDFDKEEQQMNRSKESLRLWLRLLSCESMVEQKLRSALRDEFNITLPQFDVLAELEYMGKALTMTELSKKLMVSNGNITGVVDRLVRDGYVQRMPSEEDRRVQLIKLTNYGIIEFEKIAKRHEEWVNDVFDGLSIKDIYKMTTLLGKTTDRLKVKLGKK